jgi:hypothetical protein
LESLDRDKFLIGKVNNINYIKLKQGAVHE